jgi:SanA protein
MALKRILRICLLLLILALASIYISDRIIAKSADGKLYANVDKIPYNRVGLLLGTSKFIGTGKRENPFYNFRIAAAVQLIRAGKIKYLVISGDNSKTDYNEPGSMRMDLINAGIDSSIIYLDYAGFRTFDSIKRLKEIFSQDAVTIISQQFHNERAIYLSSRMGIAAIGFNAKDVSSSIGFKTNIREKFARVKVFLDFWFGTKPKYLGEKVNIPQ